MRKLQSVCLVLLLVLLGVSSAAAESAKSLYSKGQKAEARQDYETAYQYFKQAYDKAPERTEYRSSFERNRFMAGSSHVHKGQLLLEDGKLDEALKEFQTAFKVDPSSAIAKQEIQHTQRLIEAAQHPQEPISRAPRSGGGDQAQYLAGPVQLAPISQTPITLKLSEDSKIVYETIGKLAGINVLFDPDYTPRRVHIELNSVSLEQALRIVALQSKTFWRPVTPNTIYVAQDSQQKRNEIEQQVLRTFYLNNFSTVSELQDVANLIRSVLKAERVQQFPAQNAIVMRGTPDQVALAELLINSLDRAKAEVVVDMVVMQVSKDKLKNLGISYPFTSSSNPTITFQSPSTTTSTTTTTTTSSGLTLNSLANLDATDFSVTIPSASVAMLMEDNNSTILQRPQLRSLDGQKATLKIGERVPVATGTSSSTLTSTALSTTQFQYQDVGVNIEMTPHIHGTNEVTLKISIEVSAIDSYSTIDSISEPVIGQRKVDHEIRLRDGEVSLIGGMMEHDDVKDMSGLPWLSQIPVLKYLFGQSSKEKKDTETVFVMVPHIVRRLDVDDLNQRSIEMGTQNVVEVRHSPRVAPAALAPANVPSSSPTAVTPVPPNPSGNGLRPAGPVPNAPMSGGAPPVPNAHISSIPAAAPVAPAPLGAVLSIDPPMVNQAAGSTFSVAVTLNGGQNVFSVPVQVNYDSKVLSFVGVADAGALSRDGVSVALVHRDDAASGTVQVSLMRPPGSTGITPQGQLFTLTFVAKSAGQGNIVIGPTMLKDPAMASIPANGSQALINVR
ncbi:MAG: cohesin domain-containing protein [Acidobacteriota bacterium]|nr:cohesin domain-containing protein [Acidobacteriota bacterium]